MRRRPVVVALLSLGIVALAVVAAVAQEAPPTPPAPPVTPGAPALDELVPPELAPPSRRDDQPATPPAAAPDEGSGGLLRGPDLRGGQAPTLYENYGTAGYGLDSDYGVGDSGDGLKNFAASIPWSAVVWIADLSAKLLQWAFSINVFDMAGHAVDQVSRALEDTVYRPFLLAFLVLVGAHLLFQGVVRRRGTVVGETSAWVLAALVGGGLFLAHPTSITNGLNQATSGVARTILTSVAVVDPKGGPDDGIVTRGSFAGDPADTQLRVSADRFMRIFVYKPWLAMEFGDVEKGERWGEELLKAKSLSLAEAERARNDPAYRKDINREKERDYKAIADEIHQDPQAMEWFHGHRAGERVGLAAMSLVAVAVAGGIMVVLALAVLLAQLAMLLLAMLAPIFLLAGIQPGPGRVLATRWLGLLLGAAFKRVAYAALFAVVLVVSGVFVDQASRLGWGMAMLLQVALSGALLVYRKPLLSVFEHVGHPAAWGVPGRTSVTSSGRGVVGGVLAGAAAGRLLSRSGRAPDPASARTGRDPDGPSGGRGFPRRPDPRYPTGDGSPRPGEGAGTSPDLASHRNEERGRRGGAAGVALAGATVASVAAREVAQRHGEWVTKHLTGDLEGAPAWPESNRSGQALPLPVVLERQRQRRACREWQERQRPGTSETDSRREGAER